MSSVDPKLLADWLVLQHSEQGSEEYESAFWSFERVWELCCDEPEEAWEFILAALRADSSNKVKEILSAGPLEDLLSKHGQRVIQHVESEARRNPHFASLLGGVWQNAMPQEVWSRVQAVWNRGGWDGIPDT